MYFLRYIFINQVFLHISGTVVGVPSNLGRYSDTEMALAVILTLLVAFIVGCVTGYCFTTWRRDGLNIRYLDKKQPPPESKNLNTLENNKVYNQLDNSSTYTAAPHRTPIQAKEINVVINQKSSNISAETRPVTRHKKQAYV